MCTEGLLLWAAIFDIRSKVMVMLDKQIESELSRVLASRLFAKSARLSDLLTFIVKAHLGNQLTHLNETVIAQDVFSKNESFNPSIDSIVRVSMSRLRAELDNYYTDEGARNPLRISIPVGSYAPKFEECNVPHAANDFSIKNSIALPYSKLAVSKEGGWKP